MRVLQLIVHVEYSIREDEEVSVDVSMRLNVTMWTFMILESRAGIGRVWGPISVLCKTCNVLLCVLEQSGVGAGSNWEQLVPLA